jgi:hypothetical protein
VRPYHLVAELDWDGMAAPQEAFRSPAGQATAQDVPTFATGGVQSIIDEPEEI